MSRFIEVTGDELAGQYLICSIYPDPEFEISDVDDCALYRPLSAPVLCWVGEARCYETLVPKESQKCPVVYK